MSAEGRLVVRVRVTGRVQGVGYRAWTEREARACALTGWVRNRGDGSVEAVLAGPRHAVETMIEACRRGPSHARVENVHVEVPVAAKMDAGDLQAFRVLPTV